MVVELPTKQLVSPHWPRYWTTCCSRGRGYPPPATDATADNIAGLPRPPKPVAFHWKPALIWAEWRTGGEHSFRWWTLIMERSFRLMGPGDWPDGQTERGAWFPLIGAQFELGSTHTFIMRVIQELAFVSHLWTTPSSSWYFLHLVVLSP